MHALKQRQVLDTDPSGRQPRRLETVGNRHLRVLLPAALALYAAVLVRPVFRIRIEHDA